MINDNSHKNIYSLSRSRVNEEIIFQNKLKSLIEEVSN